MRLLLKHIDNASIDVLLTYFGVRRRDEQPEQEWTFYFSPWHKGEGKILRVSNGHRVGGLYAAPLWEVADSRADIQGYGAISLVARLLGIPNDRVNRRRIVQTIVEVCDIQAPWVADEYNNGISTYVNGQKNVSVVLSEEFSAEALEMLGCRVERLYKETSTGKRLPLCNDKGEGVYQYSFGPNFGRSTKGNNFNLDLLHREFGLYEVISYVTRQFWHDKALVSRERKSHPLFPIFCFVRRATDADGVERTWGEVYQPEWSGAEGKGSERAQWLWYDATLDSRQVNQLFLGDEVSQRMLSGATAADAVREVGTGETLVTTKQVESEDENGKRVMEDVDIDPEDVRVTNAVLCTDGLNAVSCYYALNAISHTHSYAPYNDIFYHVVWPHEGDKSLKGYALKRLRKMATNLYLMYACDNEGKRNAFKVCKRFTELRMATLPDRLAEYFSVYRGGRLTRAADIRAFFAAYRMTEEEQMSYDDDLNLLFLSLFTKALPIEPLVYKPTFDKKTGKLKDYEYRVDSACLWQFMATEGYAREVDRNSTNIIGRYIHLDGCFVKELDAKSIIASALNALTEYAQRQARPGTDDFRKMRNAIITSRDIIEAKASNLPVMDVDYRSGYGPQLDHFFYRNGALRITPDEITFVPYSQVNFCVDKAEILPFDFEMPCARGEEPFTITENPEYAQRVKALAEHRRDTEGYTQVQIQQEERELQVWAQMHRWLFDFGGRPVGDWWQPLQVLRCFANEEHEAEAELQRAGQEFSDEQVRALEARLANILYSLGRPLFRYRGGGTNYMPYITENRNSVNDRAEGGSGKSLFVNLFMGCSGKIYKVNTRNMRPDSDIALFLDQFTPHCYRVIHWEDWPSGIKIDPLYNYVTSGFEFRQRHKDTVRVPLAESPGHVITSNFQQTYDDPSSSGRVVPTGFSHRFNRGDVRKNKPQQKVSDVMPGLRDNAEDMDIRLRSQIAYINAMAVQFCMKTTDRVLPPMADLNERSQKKAMGDTFIQWAKEFFSHDYNFLCPIDVPTIFSEYIELCDTSEDKKTKFSQATFRKKVAEYCADNGYVCTPEACLDSATERAKKYMRVKAWCKRSYFDDEQVWGPNRKKEIRELAQSQQALFFVKTEEEAKLLTPERVRELQREFYAKPDPSPYIDPETGQPYVLTEEEQSDWDIYMLKRQGNYTKANKLSSERDASVAGVAAADKHKTGEVEVKTADLPF